MAINLLQDRTPGNEYRAVVQVATTGTSFPSSANNTQNKGGVSTIPAFLQVDATGNAISATSPLVTSAVYSSAAITPAVTASAYVANTVVGGSMSFTGLTGHISSVTLSMKSAQTATFDMYLFTAPVTTVFADHAAATLNAADVPKMLGVISFTTPKSAFTNSTVYTASNVGINIVDTGAGIVGVLVTNGTPTFLSTSDVTVYVHTSA